MCIPRLAQETKYKYKESLDKAANTRRDLFGAEDDVVLIGEIAIIFLALSVSLELAGELLEKEVVLGEHFEEQGERWCCNKID